MTSNVSSPGGERSRSEAPRFLALGDSYTIGQSVGEADRWPVQLTRLLQGQGIDIAAPMIIAQNGWTTADLLKAIDDADAPKHFAFVTLQIGVNNQYDGLDIDAYGEELDQLLRRAIRFADHDAHRVIALSIPDWSVTPFAKDRDGATIRREIDRFNARMRHHVESAGCQLVDVTKQSEKAGIDPGTWLANDGLHPSPEMYAEWCAIVLPLALALMRASHP